MPVLCSRYSSLPEVAGEAVLFAEDPADEPIARQLLELATNPGLRADLARRGAERVTSFSWTETARLTFGVYERALTAASSRSLHERRMAAHLAERFLAV
jgi:alpha-1,3-rhamnosyl/mannosyltransferase